MNQEKNVEKHVKLEVAATVILTFENAYQYGDRELNKEELLPYQKLLPVVSGIVPRPGAQKIHSVC